MKFNQKWITFQPLNHFWVILKFRQSIELMTVANIINRYWKPNKPKYNNSNWMTKKSESSDFHYKIVLVGDSGVGKSNIISRFTKN